MSMTKTKDEFFIIRVQKLFNKNPHITREELADKLGVSIRTLYRNSVTWNIPDKLRNSTSKEKACVKYLESLGYQFD